MNKRYKCIRCGKLRVSFGGRSVLIPLWNNYHRCYNVSISTPICKKCFKRFKECVEEFWTLSDV